MRKSPNKRLPEQTGESLARMGFARAPKQEEVHRRGVPFRYSFKDTYKALKAMGTADRDPYDGTLLRYINPATGGYTYPTMSCEIQLFNAKESTKVAPAHQYGALSCRQRPGAHQGRRGLSGVEKRRHLSSCRCGSGMPMKISATTKRFCFP